TPDVHGCGRPQRKLGLVGADEHGAGTTNCLAELRGLQVARHVPDHSAVESGQAGQQEEGALLGRLELKGTRAELAARCEHERYATPPAQPVEQPRQEGEAWAEVGVEVDDVRSTTSQRPQRWPAQR